MAIPEVRVHLTVGREDLQIAFMARQDEVRKAVEAAFDHALENFDAVTVIQSEINRYLSDACNKTARELVGKYAKDILAGITPDQVFKSRWVQESVERRIGEAIANYFQYGEGQKLVDGFVRENIIKQEAPSDD